MADIRSAVEKLNMGPITHAFDAVGTTGDPSTGVLPSSDLLAQCVEDSAVLASVILRQDRRFCMPVATTKDDWLIHPSGAPGHVLIPARPTNHWNAWKALEWAVENYGSAFQLPCVRTFDGTANEALEEVSKVAAGQQGFGKVVLRHPLK